MPRLNQPREGSPLLIKKRPAEFSYWPVKKTSRRYGIQSTLFASSPWPIMRSSIQDELPCSLAEEAKSYVDQAEDYFRAAEDAGMSATRPVLFYYSFLNIAKAFIVLRSKISRASAKHGISEQLPLGGMELLDATLDIYRTSSKTFNVYDSFKSCLTGSPISAKKVAVRVPDLMPQLLQGHRIWCGIKGETERFISLERIRLLSDSKSKKIWLALYVYAGDLSRLGYSRKRFLLGTGLDKAFHEVTHNSKTGRPVLKFEQKRPINYGHRPSDKIQSLVEILKPNLWANVTTVPPYRKYYVYVNPGGEPSPISQTLTIYALFYYLGSVTRYRPHKYSEIMAGQYGGQLHEAIVNLPKQFTYLMASEFCKQEVAQAAIL